jgi:tRNA 2-thiocytidine biosynthesis protein TtcA
VKPEKIIPKRISRALMEYNLVKKGDSVLLALSGGKDSMVMAWFLNRMCRSFPTSFTLSAVHVSSPWEGGALSRWIGEKCKLWGIPYTDLPLSSIRESLREKPDCSYCSRLRREALLTYAVQKGFNSLALGHHMDDSLTTALINLTYHGRLDPLLPKRIYPALTMIRPLILLQEDIIESWALQAHAVGEKSPCPYESSQSRRVEMREKLEILSGGSVEKKRNLFNAFMESSRENQDR